MAAFSISCTTCQARLKVRDESAIGQILTCPKCGSMVLVEAPSAARGDDVPTPDPRKAPATPARAPDPSEFADTVEDLSLKMSDDESPATEQPNLGDTDREPVAANTSDSVDGLDAPPTDAPPTDDSFEDDSLPGDDSFQDDGPLLPNDAWVSAQAQRRRNMMLTAGAGIAGIVLAVGLVGFLGRGDDSSDTVAENSGGGQTETVTPTEDSGQPAIEATPTDNDEQPGADGEVEVDPTPETPAADSVPDTPDPVDPPEALTPEEVEPEPQPPTPDAAAVADPVTADPDAPAEPKPETPPLELTPSDDVAADRMTPRERLAKTLQEFGVVLEERPAEPADDEPPTEGEPPLDDEPSILPRPAHRDIDVAARLADPLPSIEFPGVPLADFLQFISDFSTIPVTLDPEALVWSQFTPAVPVNVNLSDTTVADVLTIALKELRLGYRVDGDKLIVTRAPQSDGGLLEVKFKVGDLVGNGDELRELATVIKQLIASDSWKENGGDGEIAFVETTLVIRQEEATLLRILSFCEKLRVARGLKPRSRFAPAMFQLDSRHQRCAGKLSEPVSLTYLQPTRFVSIVNRIASDTRTHILIDWTALELAGWNPDAVVPFKADGLPLGDALSTLLTPMDLTYRVVDDGLIQITTPEVLNTRLELEFYSLGDSTFGENLPGHVDDLLADAGVSVDLTSPPVWRDASSKCFVVLLSQPQQMQLQAWIDEQLAAAE